MTQGLGCPRARQIEYSTHSLRPSRKAAAWGWQSANRSSNRKAVESGLTAGTDRARLFTSPCGERPGEKPSPGYCVIRHSAERVPAQERPSLEKQCNIRLLVH